MQHALQSHSTCNDAQVTWPSVVQGFRPSLTMDVAEVLNGVADDALKAYVCFIQAAV